MMRNDYHKVFDGLKEKLDENLYYSFASLESDYVEWQRKKPETKNSHLNSFFDHLEDLENVVSVDLQSVDIANALDDEDFVIQNVNKRKNPFHLATYVNIVYQEHWWNEEELICQFNKVCDE